MGNCCTTTAGCRGDRPHLHRPGPERIAYGRLAALALPWNRPERLRVRPISLVTVAVIPARSGASPAYGRRRTRTGRRCTTLTQFPEAFCGGRIANSAPVAGLMLSTSAAQATSG